MGWVCVAVFGLPRLSNFALTRFKFLSNLASTRQSTLVIPFTVTFAGTDWGEDGYFRIVMNTDESGIEDSIIYALVDVAAAVA